MKLNKLKLYPPSSDHSAITLLFNGIEEQRHGPSHWKFNCNLTKDEEYIKLITEIYRIPFRVTVDSRSREFQFKVLHKYLATNKFLHKIGLVPSFLCTFCKRESESIEHLLIEYDYSNKVWQVLINWFIMIDIKVEALSEIDNFLDFGKSKQIFIYSSSLILAKQHIYFCRNKGYPPSLKTYLAKVALIY